MILGPGDCLGLQYFEYRPKRGKNAGTVVPCLAFMFRNRTLAELALAQLGMDASDFLTPKGNIDVVFTRQTDGSYEFKCFLSVGPAGGGGIEPRLVQRFLSTFKKSPYYLLTTGYLPKKGHLPDEYILAWEGGFIAKNKVTVDGQVYYGQKP